MRPAEATRVREKTTQTLSTAMAKALRPFVGKAVSKALTGQIATHTRPLVNGSRTTLQRSATQQYRTAIKNEKPISQVKLDRFDEDVWLQSIEKHLTSDDGELDVEITEEHVEKIIASAEHWATDAERGTLIDYAKRDERFIGWARVDPKPGSCPFCTIMISTGFRYTNPKKAYFHIGDTCEVRMVKAEDKDSYEGIESVKRAEEKYKKAVEIAGSTDLSKLVQAMKSMDKDPEGQS